MTMEAVNERREKKCGRREVFIVRWVRKGVGLKTFQSFADKSVINLKYIKCEMRSRRGVFT